MRKYLLLCLIICSCNIHLRSAAAQVYKCTANNGAITFNDSGCPDNSMQSTYPLQAPMTIPGLSQSTIKQALAAQKKTPVRVTVVADNKHPCGTVDLAQRRSDLVRKQVKSGMSQAEVESMFGKPLSQRSNNGKLSASYRSGKNKTRNVRFDQNGCVL